jgi:hypothetical protein
LRYEGLGDRLVGLFRDLESNPDMRARFVADPVSMLDGIVAGASSPATQGTINRVLYSVLGNPEFMDWATRWAEERAGDIEVSDESGSRTLSLRGDRERLFREVAGAIIQFGDREAFGNLIGVDMATLDSAFTEGDDGQPLAGRGLRPLKLPPLPKPVNVNVNFNFNITATIVVVALAIAVIPVVVVGLAPAQPLGRAELRQVTELLADELVAHARDQLGEGRQG